MTRYFAAHPAYDPAHKEAGDAKVLEGIVARARALPGVASVGEPRPLFGYYLVPYSLAPGADAWDVIVALHRDPCIRDA